MTSLGDALEVLGYVPEDDSWETDGRRTYTNGDNATREFLRVLTAALSRKGWDADKTKLRAFRHFATSEVIEIEPGGADTSGHFLHHMKAEVVG